MGLTVTDTIDLLASTSSKLEKQAILKENDCEFLRRACQLACDPMTTFGIKKIPEYENVGGDNLLSGLVRLNPMIDRVLTGNAAVEELRSILAASDEPGVIERVIKKDLDCGVSTSTLNKVFGKNFIKTFKVMLACKQDEKSLANITYPAYAQMKYDGARVCAFVSNGSVKYYSRNGREFLINSPERDFELVMMEEKRGQPIVVDGELVLRAADRSTSNGIANKAIAGTISDEEKERLEIHAWDMIDLVEYNSGKSDVPYDERLMHLRMYCPDTAKNVFVTDSVTINDVKQAMELSEKYIAEGHEGIILKNINAPWEGRRSKNLVKFKDVLDADLRVVELVEGTGKYVGMLGALILETACGGLRVRCGTGLNDTQRKSYWENKESILYKIVEVKYNSIIENKGRGETKSLFLPVFSQVRIDKDSANILEDLK